MIEIGEVYDELDVLETGQMLLLNPGEKLEHPCFFVKESKGKISELINKKYIDYEVRYFTLGRVKAYLFLFKFDEKNKDIYGQWVNICSHTDRKDYLKLNFCSDIYIVLVDEDNKVLNIERYDNYLKNNIKEVFKKLRKEECWSQKEFEMEVSSFNDMFDSRQEFYERLLTISHKNK